MLMLADKIKSWDLPSEASRKGSEDTWRQVPVPWPQRAWMLAESIWYGLPCVSSMIDCIKLHTDLPKPSVNVT